MEEQKETIQRDKRIKRNCCCIGFLLILLLIFGSIFIFKIIAPSFTPVENTTDNRAFLPTNNEEIPKPSQTEPTPTFPEPKDCKQIEPVSASSLGITPYDPGFQKKRKLHLLRYLWLYLARYL